MTTTIWRQDTKCSRSLDIAASAAEAESVQSASETPGVEILLLVRAGDQAEGVQVILLLRPRLRSQAGGQAESAKVRRYQELFTGMSKPTLKPELPSRQTF